MAITFTSVGNQYHFPCESYAVRILMEKAGLTGGDVPDQDRLERITELAGIARFDLENTMTQEQNAYMVNLHYDAAEDVFAELFAGRMMNVLKRDKQFTIPNKPNRSTVFVIVKNLANDMEEMGESRQPASLMEKVKAVAKSARETHLPLYPNEALALGLAMAICADTPDGVKKWREREKMTPQDIFAKRGIKDENVLGIRSYMDEIRQVPPMPEAR